MHVIIRNPDRYGDMGKGKFPEVILLPNATLEQAENLADYLSNYYSGCDYLWYVVGTQMNLTNVKIEEIWKMFEKRVIHPEASAVQRNEMRKAFYVGFIAMYEISVAIGEPHVSEAQGIATLNSIAQQVYQFKDKVVAEARTRRAATAPAKKEN